MNVRKGWALLAAALIAAVLLCGCGLLHFQTPEELRAAEEIAQQNKLETEAVADLTQLLTGDLNFSKDLMTSEGVLLASYRVKLPQFSTEGARAQSFGRINEHFVRELQALQQDCDSFFGQTQAAYGTNWDAVAEAMENRSVEVSYALVEAPKDYVCIRCDYRIQINRQTDTFSRAAVFLLDNGWELDLPSLLGTHYEECQSMLLNDIFSWCDANGVEITFRDRLTLADFQEDYALTKHELIFYTQPFQLNNKDGTRYAIPVPLDQYYTALRTR